MASAYELQLIILKCCYKDLINNITKGGKVLESLGTTYWKARCWHASLMMDRRSGKDANSIKRTKPSLGRLLADNDEDDNDDG